MRKNKVYFGTAHCLFQYNEGDPKPFEGMEGRELTEEEKDKYFSGGFTQVEGHSIFSMGWELPILGLRTYIVRTKYSGRSWEEYYSPNTKLLRKRLSGVGLGRIIKIIDITDL